MDSKTWTKWFIYKSGDKTNYWEKLNKLNPSNEK